MVNVSSSNGLEKCPKLRFPGFDEPWKDVHLFDVVNLRRERARSSKEVYVSTENLLQNFEGLAPYQNDDEVEGVAYYTGDSLLANIRPYLKKAWYATFDGTCSADVLAFSPKKISPTFLYNIIARDCFIEYVMSGVKGSKMPRGDKKHILDYAVAIPEKGEQEKIATFIALADHRIARQRELIATLKKYKRGLLQAVLSEKLTVTDEKWKECKIGDFLLSKNIRQIPSTEAPLMAFTATGGVCEKGERYDRGFLVKDASTKLYKRTELNDFIYSSNNLDVGSIGLNQYGSAVISDVYEIFTIVNADPWFISESIQQKTVLSAILKYRQGCLYGQYRIYAEDFQSVSLKLPSLQVQKKVGFMFEKLDRRISNEQYFLDQLSATRSFLLQQLFI